MQLSVPDPWIFWPAVEKCWILRHGAPCRFSAESKFLKKPNREILKSHDIHPANQLVCRNRKTVRVERKNLTLKRILRRLQKDNSDVTDSTLLARAVFLSRFFRGSSTLSTFELFRGRQPLILGSQRRFISNELVEAYKDREYKRLLQRLREARRPRSINPIILSVATKIFYFYYKSSNHNESI